VTDAVSDRIARMLELDLEHLQRAQVTSSKIGASLLGGLLMGAFMRLLSSSAMFASKTCCQGVFFGTEACPADDLWSGVSEAFVEKSVVRAGGLELLARGCGFPRRVPNLALDVA
jgi:hypothetical protein